jgi:hypothetical protein
MQQVRLVADNGNLVCVEQAGEDNVGELRARTPQDAPGAWELFKETDLGDGNVALSVVGGDGVERYVSAQADGTVVCNRVLSGTPLTTIPDELKTAIGDWEVARKEVLVRGDGYTVVAYRYWTGYLCAEVLSATMRLVANRSEANAWEQFVRRVEGGDHVDPTRFSLEQLARVRGAMWSARLDLPLGPRPGRADNILAMDYYEHFGESDRRRMIDAYKARGYTHAVTGPLVDLWGYHGLYPRFDIREDPGRMEWYLDAMQEWWDAGIVPVHFVHPDGWSLDDMRQLIPLYQSERAQRLLRVVVWTGWEPVKYEWTNAYWVKFLEQARDVFPDAVRLVHTVNDTDALTGGDDDKNLLGGNATAWQRTAPLLHGWLVQTAGAYNPIGDRNDPRWAGQFEQFKWDFRNLFDPKAGRASLKGRFVYGTAGWPTSSAWGEGQALKVYSAENVSFPEFWSNWPESISQDLGDIAMAAGADGYLDGGRVPV